jgi:hypothetical protein
MKRKRRRKMKNRQRGKRLDCRRDAPSMALKWEVWQSDSWDSVVELQML